MKNKILSLLLLCFTFFTFVLSACSAIFSTGEILAKQTKLKTLAAFDYSSFVNKHELVGYRLSSFNMASSQHKNSAMIASDTLSNLVEQINYIENSADYSDSEKQVQIYKLYQEADSVLYDLDSKTINYLFSLRDIMPSLTYDRFVKKFQDYYNSMQLTNAPISVK